MSSNSDAAFWRFSLEPNRDPKAERSGKYRRGADDAICPSPAVFCGLHGLADDAADGVGGGTLHLRRSVGVGAQGKSRVVVAQHTADGFHVYAILQGQRSECVSEVVKPDVLRAVLLRPDTGRSCPPAVSSSPAFPASAGGNLWRDWRGAAAPSPPAPGSCSAACGCPVPREC